MKRLAEVKDSLDIEVKQNFIDPLQNLCDKDLKEIQVLPRHPTARRPRLTPALAQPQGHPSTTARSPIGQLSRLSRELPGDPCPLPPAAPPEEAGRPPPGL